MTTVLVRAFASDVQQTGTRTLSARIAPWDSPQEVADLVDGKLERYHEGFRRGVFDAQSTTTEPGVVRRIEFVHTHEGGLGFLGHGAALRAEDDGQWADFTILRSQASNVEDLLESGVDGVSMEFVPLRGGTSIDDSGVRWRTRAHLVRVALEPVQAYPAARVMAFRGDVDEVLAAEAEQAEAEAVEARQRAEMDELQRWIVEQRERQAALRAQSQG